MLGFNQETCLGVQIGDQVGLSPDFRFRACWRFFYFSFTEIVDKPTVGF
ncbi:hypothetical protein C8J48_0995 [Desmospora activa DSM 45169]|uniref:Uncharacterized protein n=1 Tax=Desmospora activa DSM 45169 TaxID=1121389 RepID=A0A2T4Z938_9BACL|nr:hypothetical protein C8J48_0995 [Desmospora activa DSM 45169]